MFARQELPIRPTCGTRARRNVSLHRVHRNDAHRRPSGDSRPSCSDRKLPARKKHSHCVRAAHGYLVKSMPVSASIDTKRHIVSLVFTGDTSFMEWKLVMDGVLANASYVAGMCILNDRSAAGSAPSTEMVRQVVRYLVHHAESFSGCGVAMVVSSLADYGMGRMAEILSERSGVVVRAFHNREEAIAWLAEADPRRFGPLL